MNETLAVTGVDGLAEFGRYLNGLRDEKYRSYTFEMPVADGTLVDFSLDAVMEQFQDFFDGKTWWWRHLGPICPRACGGSWELTRAAITGGIAFSVTCSAVDSRR